MQHSNTERDLYCILGIERSASKDEIKRAYRAKALRWHPDRVEAGDREEAAEVFKQIKEAYDVLSDESKRQLYDQYGLASLEPDFEPPTTFVPRPIFVHPPRPAAPARSGPQIVPQSFVSPPLSPPIVEVPLGTPPTQGFRADGQYYPTPVSFGIRPDIDPNTPHFPLPVQSFPVYGGIPVYPVPPPPAPHLPQNSVNGHPMSPLNGAQAAFFPSSIPHSERVRGENVRDFVSAQPVFPVYDIPVLPPQFPTNYFGPTPFARESSPVGPFPVPPPSDRSGPQRMRVPSPPFEYASIKPRPIITPLRRHNSESLFLPTSPPLTWEEQRAAFRWGDPAGVPRPAEQPRARRLFNLFRDQRAA